MHLLAAALSTVVGADAATEKLQPYFSSYTHEHIYGRPRPHPRPPPPPLYAPMPLHPFYEFSPAGDVDGPFELNGTYHIFKCCDWRHSTAPTAAGPWTDHGVSGSPARDGGYISGSTTVVNGIPRVVMPHFEGNARTSHCCAGPDGKPHNPPWRYPCIANPPSGSCHQDYVMSMPSNLSDPDLKVWQSSSNQTVLVKGADGAKGHGWIQQDPSSAWYDDATKRWMFIGGSSVDGAAGHASGTPILELFGSVAGDDWSKGFEFLSIFSEQGLAMCDPDLIQYKSANVSVLYVCTNQYLIGNLVVADGVNSTGGNTTGGYRFQPLSNMPAGVQKIEYGAGAGKGFYQSSLDRYLLWMMSEGRGYSSAREVTVDLSIPLLLSNPAREYAAMRQSPQANITGATLQDAAAAVANCTGAPQLDVAVTFHYAGGGGPAAGDCFRLSVLGGTTVSIAFTAAHVAVLNGGSCTVDGGFVFGIKPNETSVSLRLLVDVNAVESFAQGGRAQLSFPATLHNTTGAGVGSGSGSGTGTGTQSLPFSLSSLPLSSAIPSPSSLSATFWNTSTALFAKTSKPVTVDVGVWPLAF